MLVAVPAGATVMPGDSWDGKVFGPPPVPVIPPVTADQAKAQRDTLLADATLRIGPLQDAIDIGEATDAETAALKLWKQYRVDLSRIETQAGFPKSVVWPKAPG
ncbi:tail fiber assembly protein [Variovorax sp. PAMC26660]|nr:tail fiber assembly protein [Variovorax sp. PAMC26660]